MAMNYLAIQGSATPVQCVWSAASDTEMKKHNRLGSEQLAALQFLRSVYCKQRIQNINSSGETRTQGGGETQEINMED